MRRKDDDVKQNAIKMNKNDKGTNNHQDITLNQAQMKVSLKPLRQSNFLRLLMKRFDKISTQPASKDFQRHQ